MLEGIDQLAVLGVDERDAADLVDLGHGLDEEALADHHPAALVCEKHLERAKALARQGRDLLRNIVPVMQDHVKGEVRHRLCFAIPDVARHDLVQRLVRRAADHADERRDTAHDGQTRVSADALAVEMHMRIDQAWRDHQVTGVDGLPRGRQIDAVGKAGRNARAGDSNAPAHASLAIDDFAIADKKVEHRDHPKA